MGELRCHMSMSLDGSPIDSELIESELIDEKEQSVGATIMGRRMFSTPASVNLRYRVLR